MLLFVANLHWAMGDPYVPPPPKDTNVRFVRRAHTHLRAKKYAN